MGIEPRIPRAARLLTIFSAVGTVVAVGATVSVARAGQAGPQVAAIVDAISDAPADPGCVCGKCADTGRISILFEPHACPEEINTTVSAVVAATPPAYQLGGSYWTNTATNGALQTGRAFTLTYSFVPDGTALPGDIGEPASPSNLFATLDANFPGGRSAWKAAFAQAFNRWAELTNITYVEVPDDGASFPNSPGLLAASGVTGRGDVRIGMHVIGDTVLAYNYYPNTGDMVMDSSKIASFVNSANNFRVLRNVLMHEHGHGLGLAHVIPTNATKLMEPYLNTNFDGPQEDDIRAGQRLYGDPDEYNDNDLNAVNLGALPDYAAGGAWSLARDNRSIERAGPSPDWYRLTVAAGATANFRVEPVGTAYQQGPQGGSATAFNALAARDLSLELRFVDLTTLVSRNATAAGYDESITNYTFAAAGVYYLRVAAVDGGTECQRYRLSMSNAPTPGTPAPSLLITSDGAPLSDGSNVTFTDTQTSAGRSLTLVLTNNGLGALTFGGGGAPGFSLSGPNASDYSLTPTPTGLAVGESVNLLLEFRPGATGARTASLLVRSNDPSQPAVTLNLSGNGIHTPHGVLTLQVNGTTLTSDSVVTLGNVEAGTSRGVTTVVENTGDAALTISAATLSGAAFSSGVTPPVTLQPGGRLSWPLLLTAATLGPQNGAVTFVNDSPTSNFVVRLYGVGVIPGFRDCNNNAVHDPTDIAGGTSKDCDRNSVPDECQTDADGDTVPDTCDRCPGQNDRVDTDGDGTPDCADGCPNDPLKTAPGVCGCGRPDTDTDRDATPDCNDPYPNDPYNGGFAPNTSGGTCTPAGGNGGATGGGPGLTGNTGGGSSGQSCTPGSNGGFSVGFPACGMGTLTSIAAALPMTWIAGRKRRSRRSPTR